MVTYSILCAIVIHTVDMVSGKNTSGKRQQEKYVSFARKKYINFARKKIHQEKRHQIMFVILLILMNCLQYKNIVAIRN